jgi:hypothetical protein
VLAYAGSKLIRAAKNVYSRVAEADGRRNCFILVEEEVSNVQFCRLKKQVVIQ